jgi:peptide/nickel transport system permease protein
MTYGEIVRAQFSKHRDAVWCLRILIVVIVLAVYAPVLALNVPFWTNLGGSWSFPWFRALVDPAVFKQGVDLFFNLFMAVLPFVALVWWKTRGRARRWLLLLCIAVQATGFVLVNGARDELRTPVRDYPREIHAADAGALWPLMTHHPDSRNSEFSLTKPWSRGKLQEGAEAPPEELWPFYVLGSDPLGNDVLTRLLYGTRISLSIGIVAVGLYILIGIVLGSVAGFFGGWVDDLLMFFAQVVMTIPFLFLILFIMALVEERSIYIVMLVIAAIGWPTVMRLVRGEFLRQREIDYVTAARSLGLSNRRIMFRHIVPNTLAPVFVSATFGIAWAILLESTLAFLGLGDPTAASWGELLLRGYENRENGLHLTWASGLSIFSLVLIINIIGDGLRDALDPKLRQ